MSTAVVSRHSLVSSSNKEAIKSSGEADIYCALAQHQRKEKWDFREMIQLLHQWAGLLNAQFKLDIPKLSICLDYLSVRCYGHFRPGHNGFGLEGEIALNLRYLTGQRPMADVLSTLLHEMLHAWQFTHGKPSKNCHHNAEFRAKALELGLIISAEGYTCRDQDGLLASLLLDFGIDPNQAPHIDVNVKPRGQSKLKKYSCGCTNIRVATSRFRALCLQCQCEFKHVEAT